MGLFDSLFGSKKEKYSEAERNFLLVLMKLRVRRLANSNGFSGDDAEHIVEDIVKTEDLSGDKLFSIPDTIVFKIVRDFIRIVSTNVDIARKTGIEVDIDAGQRSTIEKIEKYRNKLLGMEEVKEFPKTLDAYVFYRVWREVGFVSGGDPASIGFTRETVQVMTDLVKEGYKSNINFKIESDGRDTAGKDSMSQ